MTAISDEQIALIQQSWREVAAHKEEAGETFYGRLFGQHPELRSLFKHDMLEQRRKLISMLGFVVSKAAKIEDITPELIALGRRHNDYHIAPEQYPFVREALIYMLSQRLGNAWTEAHAEAWGSIYDYIANVMIATHESAS